MTLFRPTFCTLLALAGFAAADAPEQPVLTRYGQLWLNSPFTAKPEQTGPVRPDNPLNDFALGGVSKVRDGYYTILINKKKPDEREVIVPGSKSDYQILKVNWSKDSWRDTTVVVRKGNDTATLGFEESLLVVQAPAPQAAPQPQQQEQQQRRGRGDQNNNNDNNRRQPRPRVVLPPNRGQ